MTGLTWVSVSVSVPGSLDNEDTGHRKNRDETLPYKNSSLRLALDDSMPGEPETKFVTNVILVDLEDVYQILCHSMLSESQEFQGQ
jgi:hypothetical protein